MPNPDLLAGKMSLSKHEIRKKSKQKIWWQRWKLRLAWAWRCTNERPDVGSCWPLDAIAVDMIWCRTSCTCQRVIWRLWLPERPAMVARSSSGVVYCKELPVGIFRNSPEFSIMSPKNWNILSWQKKISSRFDWSGIWKMFQFLASLHLHRPFTRCRQEMLWWKPFSTFNSLIEIQIVSRDVFANYQRLSEICVFCWISLQSRVKWRSAEKVERCQTFRFLLKK